MSRHSRAIDGMALYADIVKRFGDATPAGNGLTFRCHFPDRHANGDRTPSGRLFIGNRGELVAVCLGCGAGWRDYVRVIGIPEREWFPDRKKEYMVNKDAIETKEVARYPYHDPEGEVVAYKVRLSTLDGLRKSFCWHRVLPAKLRALHNVPTNVEALICGHGCMDAGKYAPKKKANEWIYWAVDHVREPSKETLKETIELPDCPIYMYRIHEVDRADPRKPVFIVEGEKDVETLTALGFVATCPPHGSNVWHPDASRILSNRRIVVIPDNDKYGKEHAERVIGSLLLYGAKELRWLWPGHFGYAPPEKGGDITDWLQANFPNADRKTKATAIAELCRSTVAYSASAVSRETDKQPALASA